MTKRKTIKEFIADAIKIHGDKYDYTNTIYINSHSKIEIHCKNHNNFLQTPTNHLQGNGCPKCIHTISKGEVAWLNLLNISKNYRNKTININNKIFKPDAIDLKNKIIWEFYGDFYHGNPKKFPPEKINYINKQTFGELYQKTIEKKIFLKNAGFKLITIWESDWKSLKINDLNF